MAGGVQPWTQKPGYSTYKSPYGPKYSIQSNFHGYTARSLAKFGFIAGGFGAVAGISVLFLFEGIPRVRRDILQKIPGLGDYWVREIPPSDNPF